MIFAKASLGRIQGHPMTHRGFLLAVGIAVRPSSSASSSGHINSLWRPAPERAATTALLHNLRLATTPSSAPLELRRSPTMALLPRQAADVNPKGVEVVEFKQSGPWDDVSAADHRALYTRASVSASGSRDSGGRTSNRRGEGTGRVTPSAIRTKVSISTPRGVSADSVSTALDKVRLVL